MTINRTNKYLLFFINIIFTAIIIILLSSKTNASSQKSVYLKSDKYSLKENEEFEITLNIEDSSVGAFTSYINFNMEKIEFISGPENINVKDGEIIYVWFDKEGGNNPKNDVLGKFKFKAKESGLITITCSGDFYDSKGSKIDTNFNEEQVYINSNISNNLKNKQIKSNEDFESNLNEDNYIQDMKLNTNLETLAIENVILYPNFDNTVFEYNAQISNTEDDINILAIPENENAKVEIIKEDKLKEGNNKIIILVTSENKKASRKYIINIYKRNEEEEMEYIEYINKNKERLEEAYDIAYTINEDDLDNNSIIEDLLGKRENGSQIIALLSLFSIILIVLFAYRKLEKSKK